MTSITQIRIKTQKKTPSLEEAPARTLKKSITSRARALPFNCQTTASISRIISKERLSSLEITPLNRLHQRRIQIYRPSLPCLLIRVTLTSSLPDRWPPSTRRLDRSLEKKTRRSLTTQTKRTSSRTRRGARTKSA